MKWCLTNKAICVAATSFASIAATAYGHAGPRIYVDIENGQVVTHNGPYPPPVDGNGNVVTNPAAYGNYTTSRVFPGDPPYETTTGGQPNAGVLPLQWDDDPLNFSTEFPGIQAYPPGLLSAGTTFSYNIAGEVQWYNTTTQRFEPISQAFPVNTPLIAVTNDLGNTQFSSTGNVPGDLAFSYNGDPTDHQHLTFTICTPDDLASGFDPEDAPAGIYALPLQFTSPSAAPSKAFYILLGDRGPNTTISDPNGGIPQAVMQNEMLQAISTLPWTSTSSGLWDTDTNWDLPITPEVFHNVTITPAAGLTVTGPAAPAIINSLTIGTSSGIARLSLQPGGTLTIASGLTINPGGNINLISGAALILQAASSSHTLIQVPAGGITVAAGSQIALTNHDMIITAAAAASVLFNNAMAAPVQVTNSANSLPLWVTTAVLDGQTYRNLTANTQFDGVTFGTGDLLFRYGLAGDITGSGQINMDDYLAIDRGYIEHLTGYANGDFNHDGVVNAADYALIDLNLLDQSGATLADGMIALHSAEFGTAYTAALDALQSSQPVPEPASLAMLGAGVAAQLRPRARPARAQPLCSLSLFSLFFKESPMRPLSRKLATPIIAAFAALPAVSFAHGPNVEVAVVNNQVVTTYYFPAPNQSYLLSGNTITGENYNPLYLGQSVRTVDVTLVQDTNGGTTGFTSTTANSPSSSNNGWYGQNLNDGTAPFTGPGVAYGANADSLGNPVSNGFTASTTSPLTLTESLVGSLQQWNGSAFITSTTERLQGIRGSRGGLSNNTLVTNPTGNEAGSWTTSQNALTPDSHNQVEWRLDAIGTETADINAADGIYLAALEISSNEAGTSLPFYFLFEKNASPTDIAAAEAFVQNNYVPVNFVPVPEPASLGLLAGGIALLLARRRPV